MSTVSENVGMKEMNSTSTFLKQLAIILADALKNGKRKGYRDDHMAGVHAILKHVNNGGKANFQLVDTEDAALFEKILQNKRVPYVKMNDLNGKTTFVTRDKDAKRVEQAFEVLAEELKIGFKEQTPHEFINDHTEQNIGQALGFTEVEMEVFRKEAARLGFTYAIVGNEKEKGKHDILFAERDKDLVTKALKGMEYEFSGSEGTAYKKNMEDSLSVKNEILKASKDNKNEMLFIVNKNNPMQFITLQNGVMVEHTLAVSEKKGRDGRMEKVVKDNTAKTNPFGNRELTQAMKRFGECAIVAADKMNFIDGYDSAGRAMVADVNALGKGLTALEKEMSDGMFPVFNSMVTRSGSISFEKMMTLTDIPTSDMLKLIEALKKENLEVITVGNDIAYKEADRTKVEKVLDNTLYSKMTFKEKFQSMIYFEGRGPEGFNLDEIKEPMYIMSAKNPEYVLKVSNEGFSLLQNGETVMDLGRNEPEYNGKLETLLDSMEDIAILTETEAKKSPEDKVKLIEERVSVKENEATKEYYQAYNEKKEQFLNTDFESMNPEDREVYKRYASHKVEITYCDRTFSEKLIDKDFGTKMKERTVTETKTRKDTDPER